jgi:dipeptidyl aminopeptidase/acylaminoacyl peptidase
MVPFVDVLNTMLDASLPLTVQEYLEWGNPNVAQEYAYMKTYCPYTNIAATNYPAMLVMTSLNDSQVMYWEPAKYVAKMRATRTDKNVLLLRTRMTGGHGGASGRYDALRDQAFVFAFLLRELGISEATARGDDRPGPQGSLERQLETLESVHSFREVAISPDGKRVAWVVSIPGKGDGPSSPCSIYVSDLSTPDTPPRRVTAGDGKSMHAEHDLAWSPDSSRLAFLSDKDKKGRLQAYVTSATGGPAPKLTNLTGHLAGPRWSPDGKELAFLFIENSPRTPGPIHAGTAEVGVVEEKVYEQRLALLDLDSGRVRTVSPADLYVYEFDWSPDGKRIAAIAAHGSGDNNWYIARLYTLETASGTLKEILQPSMQIAEPRWSPDGKAIAFIGGLMSDEGANGGDVYTIPADGGQPRNLTPDLRASPSSLTWSATSGILFTANVDGGCGVGAVNPTSGEVAMHWKGRETIHARGHSPAVSFAHDGKTCAAVRHSFTQPPEVWVGPPGAWKQITHDNATLRPRWGEARNLHWNCDGETVQGWLLYPDDFKANRRYPMVVSVHGGPASARRPAWPQKLPDLTVLASHGYFLFFPNPRGSFGQGEKFTRANVKDFGHGDLRDILAGVDEVLKTAPVDKDRLAVTGWSYGGYMTMWAVTQTNRFRAAIAGAGVANWQSYYGQNSIDQWLIPYFGSTVYDDPAVYARSSPINFIKRAKTPTLVLVGERDLECPIPQSREFWHALKTLGVPTRLVVYPGEGHMFTRRDHRRDVMKRTVAWLDKYLDVNRAQDTPSKTGE